MDKGSKNGQRINMDISPKKIHKWSIITSKKCSKSLGEASQNHNKIPFHTPLE